MFIYLELLHLPGILCYGLNGFLSNSYVEALICNVMPFWVIAFKVEIKVKWGPKDGALIWYN